MLYVQIILIPAKSLSGINTLNKKNTIFFEKGGAILQTFISIS